MDEMQLCGLPKQLVHNNKLAEAVTFAQAPVLCVYVCVLFSRWLNCFTVPQQRVYSLESAVKYKEYLKISNYLPISYIPTGFETNSIQTQAHDCWIGFVWVHCWLCLEYIQIKNPGESPVFNCLHTQLLLLFPWNAKGEITRSIGLSFVFLMLPLSNIQMKSWLPGGWMSWCRINVQMEIFILAMTLRLCAHKTFVLSHDFTLFYPWKHPIVADFKQLGCFSFPWCHESIWKSGLNLLL